MHSGYGFFFFYLFIFSILKSSFYRVIRTVNIVRTGSDHFAHAGWVYQKSINLDLLKVNPYAKSLLICGRGTKLGLLNSYTNRKKKQKKKETTDFIEII